MNRKELIEKIASDCAKSNLVIAIDGPAGSGKTTLASEIAANISGSEIIHMDDLYRGWLLTLGPNLTRELQSICEQIEKSDEIVFQKYDWVNDSLLTPTTIAIPRLLILEGVGSAQKGIDDFLNLKVWIEVPIEIGLERVLRRDGDEISEAMETFLLDQEAHFTVDETKERSDFRLSGN